MLRFTIQKRLEIYQIALESINKNNYRYDLGICHAIQNAIMGDLDCDEEEYFRAESMRFKRLPEIHNNMPKDKGTGSYWWNPRHKKVRVRFMQKCIKEVKSKIKKNGTH